MLSWYCRGMIVSTEAIAKDPYGYQRRVATDVWNWTTDRWQQSWRQMGRDIRQGWSEFNKDPGAFMSRT